MQTIQAKSTRILLDDRILEKAKTLTEESAGGKPFDEWTVPDITWINGVPGCGKTTAMLRGFNTSEDMVITATKKSAEEIREKLQPILGDDAKARVRTMASFIVNGLTSTFSPKRLIVDEALMSHFGSVVMATRLAGAAYLTLMGDINQMPFIDRNDLFPMLYHRPTPSAKITREQLCTHRNPQDVAYAMSDVYSGIYSSKIKSRSLELKPYSQDSIPTDLANTLYLTHTQSEKENLIKLGCGKGEGSAVQTIHEAQGLTYETVVIVRSKTRKMDLYKSIPHAVVAISRHTDKCYYYTSVCEEDATATFVLKAQKATTEEIRDYILKMAIRIRDKTVVNNLLEAQQESP